MGLALLSSRCSNSSSQRQTNGMKRLLLLLPLLLGTQAIAGDLGPADLSAVQISAGFPSVGTTWRRGVAAGNKELIARLNLAKPN